MDTKVGADTVVRDVDGNPSNARFRANMFEEEVVLTEKQRMRRDLVENRDKMKEKIKSMTPMDLFQLFDEDDSGLISFSEFRNMLPFLDIDISDAKAFRYFQLCDTDGSGEIDIEEFQVALFTCDPTSGNPVGFQPSRHLTPMDAFEIFDEDQSGFLDEDEFRYACEYLGLKASDEVLENSFYKYDYNNTGKIDFFEFREIFIDICDVRRELEERSIDVPTLVRKKTTRKLLREVLLEEEMKERRAIQEARRYKKWLLNIRDSKKVLRKAEFRAYQELRTALDTGGHVYILGGGTHGQFNHAPIETLKTQKFKFEHFERVVELWRDRVDPVQLVDRLRVMRRAEEQEEERDADRNVTGLDKELAASLKNTKIDIDPYKEALESPFKDAKIALHTAALWGRRIHQVALSDSIMFALSDSGEVYVSGGNSFWWHEIQPDSVYQKKWRGDTTARSQLLMGVTDKQLPPDASLDRLNEVLTPDEKKAETIKVVAKYYNCWEPPPNPAQKMRYLEKDVMAKIQYDTLKFSLRCRGKQPGDLTKMELVEALYHDISLEKKLLGERAHKAIREIENQIAGLEKRKKRKLAEKFLQRIDEMWLPLREVQAEYRAAEIAKEEAGRQGQELKLAQDYQDWRMRVARNREEINPRYSPRGKSLQIDLLGTTPRGPVPVTPRGYQAGVQIAAGAAHACLIHKSGQLYAWGVGTSGRLGLDLTESDDPQADAPKPRLVQALSERPVLRVSCGYSHTGAIVSGGELYMWGSTQTGKCGFGDVVRGDECYCSIPTRVIVGPEDRKVRKLSCGAAHSAVVTEAGQLYVFGCGDGGRLGLGKGTYPTLYAPRMVESLLHERVASVSCGNTTTLVCTQVSKDWVGDVDDRYRKLTGGRVYIAGSRNVFGQQYDSFTPLTELEDTPIKQVAAGFMHSALLSADGEVFTWGHNRRGCCGLPEKYHFIPQPTSLSFLYSPAPNISRNKRAYQSSTYNMREAVYAVNGNTDGKGVNKCTSTQQEGQPWLEIDLGKIAILDKIVIWNRTDEPIDKNLPRDQYTSRLYPCWVMVGPDPFLKNASVSSLKTNLKNSASRVKFTENKRVNSWRCPLNTQARYVRIQLERFNTLSIAQVEVFGYWGYSRGAGRVSHISAGRDVTVAVVRPTSDPRDAENAYKRAAYADSLNADILRQLESFSLEYDKYGRGEVLRNDCCICKGADKCETCLMYDAYERDISKMTPAIGGRRRRLNSISEYLIKSNKPDLEPIRIPQMHRPTKWELAKNEYIKKFRFFDYMKGAARRSYITPKEAVQKDPDELARTLRFAERIDEDRLREADATDSLARHEAGSMEELLVPRDDDSSFAALSQEKDLQSQDMPSTVGSSVNHRIQYSSGSYRGNIQVGDRLETGHVVKPAFPKSMVRQLQDSEEVLKEQAASAREKRKQARKKKEQLRSQTS